MRQTSCDLIQQVITQSGLWNEGRISTHNFILTSEVYKLSEEERRQLTAIGENLYRVMSGLNTLVAFSEDPKAAKGRVWDMIRRVVRIGVPRYHRRIQAINAEDYPILFKVDMVRSQGGFWIVELDGTNTHGFGYTVLLNQIRDLMAEGTGWRLGGVAQTISAEMHAKYPGAKLFCFLSGNSRFYEPYYQILLRELQRLGIEGTIRGEWESHERHTLPEGNIVALQFPIFRGTSPLQDAFAGKYEHGELKFLIPPKIFFGSKSVFGLIKNSAMDKELENVLRRFIDETALKILRLYIPETYLVYPEWGEIPPPKLEGKSWIIKRAISSGMKGIEFIEGAEPPVARLQKEAPYQVSLQEVRDSDLFMFRYFDESGSLKEDLWFARFTAHFNFGKLADLDITARYDKKVHGAKDCLMFSAVLEK